MSYTTGPISDRHILRYAFKDTTGWQITNVDGNVGDFTSLALDEDGFPHIGYFKCNGWDPRWGIYCISWQLNYAYKDLSGWHISTVGEAGSSSISLALDEAGFPHISFGDYGLKYAYLDTTGWHSTTMDLGGSFDDFISLAMDGDDNPHISYYDRTNRNLKYTYQDAAGWHITTVDSEGWVGESNSLVLDGNGFAHISYYDSPIRT
jgi:hypothetical protein